MWLDTDSQEFKDLAKSIMDAYKDTLYGEYKDPCNLETLTEVIRAYDIPGVELIEEQGGEGEGEYAYIVFKYNDTYYKVEYNYYSYSGFDYSSASIFRVKPVTKTVTVYE